MTDKERARPLRLALRVEDTWWVAYIAQPDTMDGAIEAGRVRMAVVAEHAPSRELFKKLMTDYVQRFIEEKFGQKPDMVEQPAPDHERRGHE